MHIAIVSRSNDSVSLRVYAKNMMQHVCALGAGIVPFHELEPIPNSCDVVWDPCLCMRRIPNVLTKSPIPVIVTIHGVKAFSLPIEEIVFDHEDQNYLLGLKEALIQDWRRLSAKVKAIIAVSRYAAEEARVAFGLDSSVIHILYNGVDRVIFNPLGERKRGSYFLAVSSCNPIKNLERTIEAYERLPRKCRPEFVIIAPDVSLIQVEGVHLINQEITHEELACWYRGAVALIFPSLRETFGLPIVEAMACGCPVITSHGTGCAEVAGDAALFVDPRSTDDIADKIMRIVTDSALQHELSAKGIRRSLQFSWRTNAERLIEIIQSILPLR